MKHLGELNFYLEKYVPNLVLIQETWLNANIEEISADQVPNYVVIVRRDRHKEENRGGVIGFVRRDVRNLVGLENSEVAERTWIILHTDVGNIAIANWYRPPSADDSHINSLRDEMNDLHSEFIGFIIAGDMNIHHSKWLQLSNDNFYQDEVLKEICCEFGLKKLV